MYSRGCTNGRTSGVAYLFNISRTEITPRPSYASKTQLCPQNHLAYRAISLRFSHAAAVEDEGRNQQVSDPVLAIRRVQSNNPSLSPSLRFITFDQAQHDLGADSRKAWEKERYSNQIAKFLPIDSASPSKDHKSEISSYGKHQEDKQFVNKLLKDKGLQSHDWRIALSDLVKYTTCETTIESKDLDTLNQAPNRLQAAGSQMQDLRGSNADQIPVRRVSFRSRNYRSFRLARNIDPPAEWSEASLAAYVEALAESQKTQVRIPYVERPRQKGWTNIGDIAAAFETVFYSTAFQKSLSVEACNTALRFFYDYGMMTKARSLYVRMEDLKMHIPTETFNVLLRGSASRRDLHNFTFLLNNMTRRGFKPNEVTWTLFLQVIDCSKVRAVIVRKMAEKDMLDKIGIRRAVAAQMIHLEIVNHLGNGNDHHSFLDHMNGRYGNGWLSTSTGNKLLNEVAKRKSTSDGLSLLDEMKQAGFMPDDISMNTLLRHCLPRRQHDLAIEVLDVFEQLYRLHPGPAAYETLFLLTWRSCLLNVSTVIWRSACIYGAVSFKIKHLIFQSLLSYTPALDKGIQLDDTAKYSSLSRYAKLKKFAGRFVIGLDGPGGAALSQAMDTFEPDPQRRTLKWAQNLMDGSLRVSRNCVLQNNFPQLLRQALRMDKTWTAEGLYEKDDWRELFQRSIAVRTRVRRRHPRRLPHAFTRKGHSLRATVHRRSSQGTKPVRQRMSPRRIKGRRKAELLSRRRQTARPNQSALTSGLSDIWRNPFTHGSSRSGSRVGSIPQP